MQVGTVVAQPHAEEKSGGGGADAGLHRGLSLLVLMAVAPTTPAGTSVMSGIWWLVAGKVIDEQEVVESHFAFARQTRDRISEAFRHALAVAGVTADTLATVLSDGDAGLWRLQRETLPNAMVVLDWWHIAVRFDARCRRRAALAHYRHESGRRAVRGTGRAKWRLLGVGEVPAQLHGLSPLGTTYQYMRCALPAQTHAHHHRLTASELAGYLERNEGADPYAARHRRGEVILKPLSWKFGQRDHRQTDEQETANALEQGDGAGLPRRANSGAERYARGRPPSLLSWLPPRERRRDNLIGSVMNPTNSCALNYGQAQETAVTPRRTLRPFRDFSCLTFRAPHLRDPPPGARWYATPVQTRQVGPVWREP